jgi:uncharacterized protein YciI
MSDHAAFMNALADEGLVLFAGPLAGTEGGRLRALLIISAHSEDEIRRRLANDPWTISGHLEVTSIEPWSVFVGAERLSSDHVPTATPRLIQRDHRSGTGGAGDSDAAGAAG